MKRLKNYKYLLALLALPLLVVTCMTIEDIIHPDNPQVDSEIEILVKLKIVAETDRNSKLAFGVLAPKSWNLANDATVLLTTTALHPGNAVVKEVMKVIPSTELNPTTGTPWSASFQSTFGLLDNLGPVEWVVFESATEFMLHDNDANKKQIEGTVAIKFMTGNQNIKLFMGYTFCGKKFGFSNDEYKENIKSKVLAVTGGAGPIVDYTTVPLVSTLPSSFGYGDIFSIKFEEETTTEITPLKGAEKVYLWGKVVYDGGDKIISEISSKTLMEKVGKTTWQRYIYPKEFFDLPSNATILETYFHFSNESQSIIVQDEGGVDFMIIESCE